MYNTSQISAEIREKEQNLDTHKLENSFHSLLISAKHKLIN